MNEYLPCSDTTLRATPWHLLPQLPKQGGFVFPEPWNTPASRITNDEYNKYLEPVGYSYWRNINNHKNREYLTVFLSFRDRGIYIFNVNKTNGSITNIRPLNIRHSGEGLYFSANNPDIIYGAIDNSFYKFNIENGLAEEIFKVSSDKYLWQCHSDYTETIHSATVRDRATYEMLGAIVYDENRGEKFFPRKGVFDECQIDRSGTFLLVKETLNDLGESNIIYDLITGNEEIISNNDGAVGHSDMGIRYAVGEVDMSELPNCIELRELATLNRKLQYYTPQWSTGVGHVSHTNVHNPSFIVISNASRENKPRQNEIIQVPLDGSGTFRPLAPSCVDLTDSSDDYRNMPKGNLCPYGEYFIWTANHRSDRLDAFVLKV